MNVAQPRRSANIGRTTSCQTSGFMSANSSRTTPSRYGPRNASGLSAPYRRIMEPLTRSTRNSDSFLGAGRMKTADALMVLYYVVLSGVLVFTRSFKKNSAPDGRGFFSDSDLSVPESGA